MCCSLLTLVCSATPNLWFHKTPSTSVYLYQMDLRVVFSSRINLHKVINYTLVILLTQVNSDEKCLPLLHKNTTMYHII